MLELQSLEMRFGPLQLWTDVNATIPPATLTAIVGPSGAGKSTLLNCVGMLVAPTSGRILYGGRDLTRLRGSAQRRVRRRNLGYLFQNYALIEDTTVADNLRVATSAHRLRGRQAVEAMRNALAEVGLAGCLAEPVAHLSGGEQQRVALARILIRSPQLILADEPTGALDRANADMVIAHLQRMAARGGTILIATHDSHVRRACDESIELAGHGGRGPDRRSLAEPRRATG